MKKELLPALLKAERFCAYQERSSYEVEKKLGTLRLSPADIKEIITSLKEQDYLNEERFARLFVSGKFRIKKWGKIKIAHELKMKKIPAQVIQDALNGIAPNDYRQTIKDLIKKKEKEVKKDSPAIKNQKILRFVLSKGFETGEVIAMLKECKF